MITLAFDTATDRCTVAATDGVRVAHAVVDGSRRHAAAILGLIDATLREIGGGAPDVRRIVTGDGPGSFTGLRVAASVAKALTWQRRVEWYVAPSLLVRATAHVPAAGGVVLALSDALRGELYAGCWRVDGQTIEQVGPAPRAVTPASLAERRPFDVVVGSVPDALLDAVRTATGCEPVTGDAALPDARLLLGLVDKTGGASRVADPFNWEPVYGRPAEAQAVWERTHGMELPIAPGIAR